MPDTNICWEKQPLGTMTDVALAAQLGVHRLTVRDHRLAQGVPAYRPPKPDIDWTKQDLGKKPDKEIATALGVKLHVVSEAREGLGIEPYKRGEDWTNVPLGQKPDKVIARETGRSYAQVLHARRRLGIPALGGNPRKGIDWDNQPLLGKVPDGELARQLGVTSRTVQDARESRKIAAYQAPLGT